MIDQSKFIERVMAKSYYLSSGLMFDALENEYWLVVDSYIEDMINKLNRITNNQKQEYWTIFQSRIFHFFLKNNHWESENHKIDVLGDKIG